MSNALDLPTLHAERRSLLRQRRPLLEALAACLVQHRPDEELRAATVRLYDQLAVNALQVAAYDPQESLFADERPSHA